MRTGGKALAGVLLALAVIVLPFPANAAERDRDTEIQIKNITFLEIPVTSSGARATESCGTVSKGQLLTLLYLEYLKTPAVPYRYFEGTMLAAPVVSARYGIAENVEIGASGAGHLWALTEEGSDRNEVGDFSLWTKWAAMKPKGKRPALGLYWGAKLPNASDETGLGTDHADIFAKVIATRRIHHVYQVDLNFGLAILGDPTKEREQNDVFTYALAVTRIMGGKTSTMAEIEGASGKGHAPPQCNLRAGFVRYGAERFHYFAAVSAGLTGHSPDWGVRLGMGAAFGGKKKAE